MKQYVVLLFGLLCVLAVSLFPAEARQAPSSQRYQQATASQSAELAEAQRLSDSAVRLYDISKYDEALPLVKRALEIRERVLGPIHVQVALTLAALGHVYMASDRFDEAGKVLHRSRDILEARPNPNDLQLVTVLEDLAFLNFRKHDYVNTESLIQRSLSIKEKTLGPVDVQVADSVVSLGRVFEMERKYDEADAQYDARNSN